MSRTRSPTYGYCAMLNAFGAIIWLKQAIAMKNSFGATLAAVVALSAGGTQVLRFADDQTQHNLVVLTADRCGIGRYRDANGVCRREYAFGKALKQFYGSCGGMNAHRVCNFTGQCWMICD